MKRLLMVFLLMNVRLGGVVFAQSEAEEPTVLTLRPAGEPVPALKYRILPERRELVPGNAAIFYHRANQMVLQTRWGSTFREQGEESGRDSEIQVESDIVDWVAGPLEKIPVEKAREQLDRFRNPLHEIELGARRRDCDWEFELREETIELLLPEIQEMRTLARLVTLRVRVAVIDGKIDEAVHWLQTGYAMTRHVSEGTSLIQSLVGIAMANVMNQALRDLIQVPGTPSLFWALAERPEPFIDLGAAMESERTLLDRFLPGLEELEGVPWSEERGRQFSDELREKLKGLTGEPSVDQVTESKLGLTLLVAKLYPEAKRRLIEEGRDREQVEAMPAVQVVALSTLQHYRRLRDEAYKWLSLPYPQSYQQLEEAQNRIMDEAKGHDVLLTAFAILLTPINAVRAAELRLDRQFAALQCVEAIRLHAAAHGDTLPGSLDELTDAPVPLDPATGKAFRYEVQGDVARLTAPLIPGGPDQPAFRIDYELRLAR